MTMKWKIILAVAAVAATTASFTLPKPDDEPRGQVATLEIGD
jgi:hypothetical protein